ncbi:hypothetical protein [Streptomyces sp. NPDC048057]|uniref:hypothetical protein n=1 Tax=Streptomyces sp. NPDC048057 TaxID=3155628 RepID=UPI0033EFC6AD
MPLNALVTGVRPVFLGIGVPFLGVRLPEGHFPGAFQYASGLQDLVQRAGEFEAAMGILPVLDLEDDVIADLH